MEPLLLVVGIVLVVLVFLYRIFDPLETRRRAAAARKHQQAAARIEEQLQATRERLGQLEGGKTRRQKSTPTSSTRDDT